MSAPGEEFVELLVALVHAVLHALGHHALEDLDGGEHAVVDEPRAATGQLLEAHGVDRHLVGGALVLERLDDQLVLAHGMEDAIEGIGVALGIRLLVAIAAAGAEVPLDDVRLQGAGSDPLAELVAVGMRAEHRLHGSVELARDVGVGLSGGGVDDDGIAHDSFSFDGWAPAAPVLLADAGGPPADARVDAASSASSRRYCPS